MANRVGDNRIGIPQKVEVTSRNLWCQMTALTGVGLGILTVLNSLKHFPDFSRLGASITIFSTAVLAVIRSIDVSFSGQTPLLRAAANGQLAWMKFLLFFGANTNKKDNLGNSAISLAHHNSSIEAVKLLIENGADLYTIYGPTAITCLHNASLKGDVAVIRMLLQKAPDKKRLMEQKMNDDSTPLFLACQYGRVEAAQELIENGADLYAVNGPNEVTALHIAAFEGHSAVIRMFLQKASDKKRLMEHKINNGSTPLFLACQYGRVEAAQELIENGADLYAVNGPSEVTALHIAAFNGHSAVIRMLLQKAPDKKSLMEQKSKSSFTSLYLACQYGRVEAAQELIENGADLYAVNRPIEATALHIAAFQGHSAVIRILLQKASDKKRLMEQKINNGSTPLFLACQYGRVEAAQELIENGADLYAAIGEITPLHIAAREGHVAVIKMILEKAPDKKSLQKKILNNAALLFCACEKDDPKVLRFLIENGVKINNPSDPTREPTVLHFAGRKGHVSLVRYILEVNENLSLQYGKQLYLDHIKETAVIDEYLNHQKKILSKAASNLFWRKVDSDESLIFVLNCLYRELLLINALKNTSFRFLRDRELASDVFSGLFNSPIFFQHLHFVNSICSKTNNLMQLKGIRTSVLQIRDCLCKISPIYPLLFYTPYSIETWDFEKMRNRKLIDSYVRLAEFCESKIHSLEDENPEQDFDDSDVFALLATMNILMAQNVSGVQVNAPAIFENLIGMPVQKISEAGFETGADLRKIGITFTLRDLSEKLATEPQVISSILDELTRIEGVIDRDISTPLELLGLIKDLKIELGIGKIPNLKDFHRRYVIEVLKAHLQKI
jgi:ankyrin repeat protein